MHCACNVRLDVVANHYGSFLSRSRLAHGIVEEDRAGFVGSCIFAEYDMGEVWVQSACLELAILYFMEPVAAYSQRIPLALEVVEQLACAVHYSCLGGTAFEEVVAKPEAELRSWGNALAA